MLLFRKVLYNRGGSLMCTVALLIPWILFFLFKDYISLYLLNAAINIFSIKLCLQIKLHLVNGE